MGFFKGWEITFMGRITESAATKREDGGGQENIFCEVIGSEANLLPRLHNPLSHFPILAAYVTQRRAQACL
jgi:hypothetical protein